MSKSLYQQKGGNEILEFQQRQLKELENVEPITEETGYLLGIVLEFLSTAQELKSKPLAKKTEAEKQIRKLRSKMSLLNKVSATGRELLLTEGILVLK